MVVCRPIIRCVVVSPWYRQRSRQLFRLSAATSVDCVRRTVVPLPAASAESAWLLIRDCLHLLVYVPTAVVI